MARKVIASEKTYVVDPRAAVVFEVSGRHLDKENREVYEIKGENSKFEITRTPGMIEFDTQEVTKGGTVYNYLAAGDDDKYIEHVLDKLGAADASLSRIYNGDYAKNTELGVKYDHIRNEIKALDKDLERKYGSNLSISSKCVNERAERLNILIGENEMTKDYLIYNKCTDKKNPMEYGDAVKEVNNEIAAQRGSVQNLRAKIGLAGYENQLHSLEREGRFKQAMGGIAASTLALVTYALGGFLVPFVAGIGGITLIGGALFNKYKNEADRLQAKETEAKIENLKHILKETGKSNNPKGPEGPGGSNGPDGGGGNPKHEKGMKLSPEVQKVLAEKNAEIANAKSEVEKYKRETEALQDKMDKLNDKLDRLEALLSERDKAEKTPDKKDDPEKSKDKPLDKEDKKEKPVDKDKDKPDKDKDKSEKDKDKSEKDKDKAEDKKDKADKKPEKEPEKRPEKAPDKKSEKAPEKKPDKSENKPEAKVENKPDKPEAKVEPKVESKTEPKVEPKNEPKVEAKPDDGKQKLEVKSPFDVEKKPKQKPIEKVKPDSENKSEKNSGENDKKILKVEKTPIKPEVKPEVPVERVKPERVIVKPPKIERPSSKEVPNKISRKTELQTESKLFNFYEKLASAYPEHIVSSSKFDDREGNFDYKFNELKLEVFTKGKDGYDKSENNDGKSEIKFSSEKDTSFINRIEAGGVGFNFNKNLIMGKADNVEQYLKSPLEAIASMITEKNSDKKAITIKDLEIPNDKGDIETVSFDKLPEVSSSMLDKVKDGLGTIFGSLAGSMIELLASPLENGNDIVEALRNKDKPDSLEAMADATVEAAAGDPNESADLSAKKDDIDKDNPIVDNPGENESINELDNNDANDLTDDIDKGVDNNPDAPNDNPDDNDDSWDDIE